MLLFLTGCLKEQHVIWKAEIEGGEVYDCIFSTTDNKVILVTSNDIICYNMETGERVWKTKMNILRTPLFINEILVTGSMYLPGLYHIDIKNGKIKKKIDMTSEIYKVGVENEASFILIGSESSEQSQLQRFNIINGETEKILSIDGVPKNQLEYYKENIVLTIGSGYISYLLLIDGNTKKVKRKDAIANDRVFRDEFVCMKDCVFYVSNSDAEAKLVQVDIETGNVLEEFPIDFSVNYLEGDGEKILIAGESLYLFDASDKTFFEIVDNKSYIGHGSTIDNGRVVFSDENTIYCYSIADGIIKEIYDLGGRQLFNAFMHEDKIIVILADNIRESVLDGKSFALLALAAYE
jgi:outer membrane protein assembly factor BamB